MSDLLRRNLAPINDTAWKAIDDQARDTLSRCLSARKTIDVAGPFGWEKATLNLGTVKVMTHNKNGEPDWGLRESLPMVEVRMPFTLNQFDVDNIVRGAKNPDLSSLINAAQKLAAFEEQLVYNGLEAAGVQGMLADSGNKPVPLGKTPKSVLEGLQKAIFSLKVHGIAGPYQLVLGTDGYSRLGIANVESDYPLRKRVLTMLQDGDIIWSPALKTGAVVSLRGGDFELTIGQDISVGYSGHTSTEIMLFLTESLTYRTHEGNAVVPLI